MPVETPHERYRGLEYALMRACFEGETAIKAQGDVLLPRPSGLVDLAFREPDKAALAESHYLSYKSRAQFVELLAPAIDGLIGMAFRSDWEIDLPPRLEYLFNRATPDGMGLHELSECIVREVLLTGHYGLYPDIQGSLPVLKPYPAESIINWRTDDGKTTLVVLRELVYEESPGDQFKRSERTVYRVLLLEDGNYYTEEHRKVTRGFEITDLAQPSLQIGELPFVIAGSVGRDIEPDKAIPMRPMAKHLLSGYVTSADYKQSLHMSAQPTPVFTGLTPTDAPPMLGSAAAVVMTNENAKAFYMEVSGRGISDMKAEVAEQIVLAMQHSHHLAERGASVESGEALNARTQSKTASVRAVVKNSAYALEQALRYTAMYIGANEDDVSVVPNLTFTSAQVDAALLKAFSEAVTLGTITQSEFDQYRRTAGLTEKTDEELAEEREEEQDDRAAETVGLGVPQKPVQVPDDEVLAA